MSNADRQAKVLRVGIVRDGKLEDARLIELGEDVTVGAGAGVTFQVPQGSVDTPQFTLFAFRQGRYQLQFDGSMKGKISVDGNPVSLDKARRGEVPAEKTGELWAIPLTESDKGKLRLGKTTLVFQFVPPPPVAAAGTAVVHFRPRFFEEDPVLYGSLALWSALGFVFVLLVNNLEVPPRTIDDVPDRFVKLVVDRPPTPPPEQETKPKVDESVKGPATKAAPKDEPAPAKEKKAPAPKKGTADEARAVKDAEKKLAEENALFKAAQAKMMGTVGSKARGTVLSDNAEGNFDDIDAKLRAAAEAGAQLGDGSQIRGSEGVIGGTGVRGQSGGVQSGQTGEVEVAGGPAVKVPKGTVEGGNLEFDGGDSANVLGVVRRFQGQLNYCYEQELKSDPTLRGRVVVAWEVLGGRAVDVHVVDNGTGSDSFARCIVSKIGNWRFSGVDDGFAKRPFIFQPQD